MKPWWRAKALNSLHLSKPLKLPMPRENQMSFFYPLSCLRMANQSALLLTMTPSSFLTLGSTDHVSLPWPSPCLTLRISNILSWSSKIPIMKAALSKKKKLLPGALSNVKSGLKISSLWQWPNIKKTFRWVPSPFRPFKLKIPSVKSFPIIINSTSTSPSQRKSAWWLITSMAWRKGARRVRMF